MEEEKNLPETVEEAEVEDYEEVVGNEILDLIRSDISTKELGEKLSDYHDGDLADAFEKLTKEERQRCYKALKVQRLSEIFAYLEDVEDYFHEIGLEKSADILEEMDADDAIDLLETLPEDYREEIVNRIEKEAREDIELIASYDEDEVGSAMTTNFIVIKKGLSVKAAMKELIRQSGENDNISTIYVVDENDVFYGAIDLKDLIRAREDTDLETITSTSYPYVNARAKKSDELERVRDYNEDSIPVLDEDDKILGVITAFDVVEAVDDELGEDYAKLAGLTAEEDLKEPLKQSIKKRMPWLIALLALGLVVSTVVGVFTDVVAAVPIVIAFQSLILDMAGNSGTQSLAVTIRVLMDEALTGKEKLKFVLKEMRVGLSNGFILGSTAFVLVGLYIHFLKGQPFGTAFTISACVGVALWLAMIIASMVGTLIPMMFKKLKVDPAVASGPFITTINDLVAVVTYYGLSYLFLIKLLGFAAIMG